MHERHLQLVRPTTELSEPSEPPSRFSFDDMFRQYAPYVAAIALRLLGRVDEVEDVVQDVFLQAHRGLRGLREPAALKGWLATVTVRTAHRRLRSRRLRLLLRMVPAYDYEILAQPDLSAEESARVAEIYALLDKLPARERLAWSLRYIEGEQLTRVAELCGASLAAVKRHIAAANKRLGELAHE